MTAKLLKLLGAVAGVTALVTFAGGAVLWVRFDALDLPADQVVTLLPKQLLLTIGARELLLPLAIGGAVALLLVITARDRDARWWTALGAAILVTVVVLIVIVHDYAIGSWLVVGLAALAGLAAVVVVARVTNNDQREPLAWASLGALLLIAVVVVVVHESNEPTLEPVAALLDGTPRSVSGFYIGQTSDRLYIAPLPGSGAGEDPFADQPLDRVIELHRDQVTALVLRAPVTTGADGPGRDEARTLLADLQVAGVDVTKLPVTPVTTTDAVATFAPLVNLHVRETAWPQTTDAFLSHAWLTWSAPDCPTWIQGAGDGDGAYGNPSDHPELMGRFVPNRLAGAGAYARQPVGENCRPGRGAPIAADQHTRPWDAGNGRPRGLPLREGWALAVRADARTPTPHRSHEGPQEALHDAPVYYEIEQTDTEERITYWFFYGLSHPPGVPRYTEAASHQGDWERISVLLRHRRDSSVYLPVSVRFHTHDGHRDIPWQAILRTAGGISSELTHPVAYSARGSHATYWRTGDYAIVVKLGGHDALTVYDHAMACSDCPQWRTWEQLVDARVQPWYGFGGAWGAAGSVKGGGTTGPLGPSRYKAAGANPAPTRTLRRFVTPTRPADPES